MAHGRGNDGPASNSSGLGSFAEDGLASTNLKLMSFGDGDENGPAPLKNGVPREIDLSTYRQNPSLGRQPHLESENRTIGLAERQESFRSLISECPNLDSLSIDNLATSQVQQNMVITSVTREAGHFNIVPSIENNEATRLNIPVRRIDASVGPLSPANENGMMASSIGTASSERSTNQSQSSCGSRASRVVQNRKLIADSTLIFQLPLNFINFLSATFNRNDCKNWKDLVSLYNWNFGQITVFKNKSHPDGIFCSLLNEKEFQLYNIEQLKLDLTEIPRLDAYDDLLKMIEDYNSSL